jgi:phospholipid-transporting ATPase
MGTVAYTCVVLTVTGKLVLETRYWTWINALFVALSILVWFLFLMVYGLLWIGAPGLDVGEDLYGEVFFIYTSPLFWFTIIIVPAICLYRDFFWK